jgi:SEC-C motif-containing protein
MAEQQCHCGSGKPFSLCCQPILSNQSPAATAEALMRSRYTANVLRDLAYLLESWHPSTRPSSMDQGQMVDWCGLTIVAASKGQPGDKDGVVEFIARYADGLQQGVLRERSRFVFAEDRWYYLDGLVSETAGTEQARIGRNAPCPCGSGKKYKKCCLRSG